MSSPQPEDALVDLADQVHLFREIADDRVEGMKKRAEQLNSRAALLITAAALTSTLGASVPGNAWAILAILTTLAAAAAGVLAVFPMRDNYPKLEELRARFLETGSSQAELDHADEQVITYNDQVQKLSWRGRLIQIGFLLLGASILFRSLLVLGVSIRVG
ncbi:hypothetical protein M8J71_01215 [Pseudarthrobacter sp. R1]|uniref:hypothetical protein n=1 Tax=Pseudarthrobacter sp. R1 TaxID=2944934 RepID=UPI00210E021D|nr:hypothetical protein [Pseudarthrobacter sp. R1]MCQ6269125.1 hypothetical protein [Pseudarthrobacter sp. R1]